MASDKGLDGGDPSGHQIPHVFFVSLIYEENAHNREAGEDQGGRSEEYDVDPGLEIVVPYRFLLVLQSCEKMQQGQQSQKEIRERREEHHPVPLRP